MTIGKRRLLVFLCLFAFLCSCAVSCEEAPTDLSSMQSPVENEPSPTPATPHSPETSDENGVPKDIGFGIMEVLVFNAGKADAILVLTENHTVMIDTGEEEHGQLIVDELLSRDITVVDYLIITHFDKDHVGGAAEIISSLDVKAVVVPNYRRDSRHYLRFADAMHENSIEPVILKKYSPLEFILDGVIFTTYPSDLDFAEYSVGQDASEADYDDEDDEDIELPNVNNFSLVTSITHGNKNFLFTGDAKARRLKELLSTREIMNTQYDFLKVPHHGRYNKRSMEFILAISPSYAVITCSKDNPADGQIVSSLSSVRAEAFLTTQGAVYCISNGELLTVEYQ